MEGGGLRRFLWGQNNASLSLGPKYANKDNNNGVLGSLASLLNLPYIANPNRPGSGFSFSSTCTGSDGEPSIHMDHERLKSFHCSV